MTKVVVALVGVLAAVLLAIGGVYLYHNLAPDAQQAAAEEGEEAAVDPEKASKGPLGRMKEAKTPSDIPSLLTYAMKKSLDAVGWLDVPGTDINNVVMQGADNTYYERRDEDGNDAVYGCYFLDMECALGNREDFLPNTIIYGHSDLKDNPDGPRFSQLFRFLDDGFAAENKYMYLTTLEGRYTFEIFSVFYTDTSFDYIRVHMTDEQALELANKAKSLSVRDYGIQPAAGDKLLTLSTCSVRDGNDGSHRFVVMGRLTGAQATQAPPAVEEPVDEPGQSSRTPQDDSSSEAPPTASSGAEQPQSGVQQQPSAQQPGMPGEMQPPQMPQIGDIQLPEMPQFEQPNFP